MIVTRNAALFRGKRVLDLASHDGRWSWAALNAGATHVTGVEGRNELVDKSHSNFEQLSLRRNCYEFICADVFDFLTNAAGKAQKWDTVLCLGLFYHVMDHYRLLKLMTDTTSDGLIMDTGLVDSSKPFIRLINEDNENYLHALPSLKGQQVEVVGYPSRAALQMMANSLGWNIEFLKWRKRDFTDLSCLDDYFDRGWNRFRRFTAILVQQSP